MEELPECLRLEEMQWGSGSGSGQVELPRPPDAGLGRRWQAGSHRKACQALDKGRVCTKGPQRGLCRGYEKAAKSSTVGSLPACEGGRQGMGSRLWIPSHPDWGGDPRQTHRAVTNSP